MLVYDILKFETNLHQAMVTGNWHSICFFFLFPVPDPDPFCGIYSIAYDAECGIQKLTDFKTFSLIMN